MCPAAVDHLKHQSSKQSFASRWSLENSCVGNEAERCGHHAPLQALKTHPHEVDWHCHDCRSLAMSGAGG